MEYIKEEGKAVDESIRNDIVNFNSEIDQTRMLCQHATNTARNVEMVLEKVNSEQVIICKQFFELKESAHEKMLKVTQEISNAVHKFRNLHGGSIDKVKEIEAELANVRNNLDQYHLDINQGSERHERLSKKVREITDDKTIVKKIETIKNENSGVVKSIEHQLSQTNHKLYILEQYCDKYMPIKIQTEISATLAPVLSPKKKLSMQKSVTVKLNQLKNSLVNDRQANLEIKLNTIAKESGAEKFSLRTPKTALGIQGSFYSNPDDTNNQDPARAMRKTTGAFNDPNDMLLESNGVIARTQKTSSVRGNVEENENVFKETSNINILESNDLNNYESISPSKYSYLNM
jgi:hypothetical protein